MIYNFNLGIGWASSGVGTQMAMKSTSQTSEKSVVAEKLTYHKRVTETNRVGRMANNFYFENNFAKKYKILRIIGVI